MAAPSIRKQINKVHKAGKLCFVLVLLSLISSVVETFYSTGLTIILEIVFNVIETIGFILLFFAFARLVLLTSSMAAALQEIIQEEAQETSDQNGI